MRGLDVSRWQGEIDWAAVRGGCPELRFAFIRAGGGVAGDPPEWQYGVDRESADNLIGARRSGISVGGYVPFNPSVSSAEEAAIEAFTYLETGGFFERGMLVPALDVEKVPGLDIEDTCQDWSTWTKDLIYWWRKLIGNRCGERVILYSSGSFFNDHLPHAFDRNKDVKLGVWVAHWNDTPGETPYTVGGRAILHQYTAEGSVPGIIGNVDLNSTMAGAHLGDWIIQA